MNTLRFLALLLFASPCFAAEPLVSGVPVGKRPGPYSFLVATGKERGQPTCFICDQGDKPAAVVFARTLNDPLAKLLVKLDAEMGHRKDFKAWLTVLTVKADLDALAKWSKEAGLKSVAVGAFEDADGPPAYTIHKDADPTVVIFEKQKVKANFAYKSGELQAASVDEILKKLGEVLGKP